MATAGGAVSRSAWQGLLRPATRPLARARSRLLVSKPRWISSEEQARPDQLSSVLPENVKSRDQWLLGQFGGLVKSIDQRSFAECKEPVRLFASEIKCLCSWNEASGSRQAIYVPGDASRPKSKKHASLDPPVPSLYVGYCHPGRGPRWASWDDALAALCAMKPELKLNDVDVMIHDDALVLLLIIARNKVQTLFAEKLRGFALDMSLIDDTLVIKKRPEHAPCGVVPVPTRMPRLWEYYTAATDSAPEVEDSSVHYQLLRYNMGPLSCLVHTRLHGTVQELPTPKDPLERQQARKLHGVDVITAGQGVRTPTTFQTVVRPLPFNPEREFKRLTRFAPRLWLSGQTRLGIADLVMPGEAGYPGGLTVVEMGDLVRSFEDDNQLSLRRLAGLLAALRDAVRTHGAPCVAVFLPPARAHRGPNDPPPDHTIHVHSAGPDEAPVLLDSHKEHFWSQKKVSSENARPQDAINEHAQPQKSLIRQWGKWLGF